MKTQPQKDEDPPLRQDSKMLIRREGKAVTTLRPLHVGRLTANIRTKLMSIWEPERGRTGLNHDENAREGRPVGRFLPKPTEKAYGEVK